MYKCRLIIYYVFYASVDFRRRRQLAMVTEFVSHLSDASIKSRNWRNWSPISTFRQKPTCRYTYSTRIAHHLTIRHRRVAAAASVCLLTTQMNLDFYRTRAAHVHTLRQHIIARRRIHSEYCTPHTCVLVFSRVCALGERQQSISSAAHYHAL